MMNAAHDVERIKATTVNNTTGSDGFTPLSKLFIPRPSSMANEALASGVSVRALEARHAGATRSALDRHRKHIPPVLTRAREAQEVAEADSLPSQVKEWLSTCKELFAQAKEDKSRSGAASAGREVSRCLEMLGKLSGELQSGKGLTVNLDITKIDIHALAKEQITAIYERIEREQLGEIAQMSDEELEADILRLSTARTGDDVPKSLPGAPPQLIEGA